MKFEKLVISIQNAHDGLQRAAVKAVNRSLTVRNWLIGLYIVEFEQNGQDRAKYGERLLPELSASVKIRGLSETNLKLCRLFYLAYPHLVSAIKATLENSDIAVNRIRQSSTDELEQQQETGLEENTQQLEVASKILSKLSFTHLVQLLPIRDIAKRTFYELECIKQTWSVEELKRQINTLYYERSGISKKPEQLAKVVKQILSSIVPMTAKNR